MHVSQFHYREGNWNPPLPLKDESQLLIGFGDRQLILNEPFQASLQGAFPLAEHIGCSTSGEILADEVYDDSFVLSALGFDDTSLQVATADIADFGDSYTAGKKLAESLALESLRYVLVLSDGQQVNGTDLVHGIAEILPENVLVTGGLAGDGDRFQETVVWHNRQAQPGTIVLCGFYGSSIQLGHGTLGGWVTFGPERQITRSSANVLYELDDQPALDLYKQYLGDFSRQLPSSALRFPLSMQMPGDKESVVRTILGIDEENKSMTFAGNMPEGASTKLMKANIDSLIDGASGAAVNAKSSLKSGDAKLALLISCVGRRLVLGQRAFEELERVSEILGGDCATCGFYSYGEISPLLESAECRLHNQTMTVTTFSETNPRDDA